MQGLPPTVDIDTILKTNAEYYPDTIRLYTGVYKGGREFIKIIDQMLVQREIERARPKLYEMRKDRADYINRAGGLLDFLRAAVFKSEPYLNPEPESEYWESLNWNADGLGSSLSTMLRDALLSMTVNQRAYLLADFRGALASPMDSGSMDAHLRVLTAEVVDDWSHDTLGALEWIRTHTVEMVRAEGSALVTQPNIEHHKWMYFDSDTICTYEAFSKPGVSLNTSDGDAMLTSEQHHDFGQLPVFEIRAGTGQWVMDRIFPVVKSLYNREVAVTWQLDKQSYSQMVLTLADQTRVNGIFSGETAAMVLEIGESAGFITPPGTSFAPQFDDVDRLTKALYEVVQALALNASATQTQNARQSAAAKELDRDPLQTLLASFAAPIVSALKQWVDAVKLFRNETLDVEIRGLDQFTLTMEELTNGTKEGEEAAGGITGNGTADSSGSTTSEEESGGDTEE